MLSQWNQAKILVRFMSPNLLNIHCERKFINNPSDWFWQNLNSLSFLLIFSCDLNHSIPPFHLKCHVHCSTYWKIESVLNSIHTQNIDSFVLLSLLDLFIGKDNFQYWWVETSIYFSFFNEKGVILEKKKHSDTEYKNV